MFTRSTAWLLAGITAVALGLVGVVLPLLSATPFLLLAAFCFARSSPRLHCWIVEHPRYGPPFRAWQAHGVIVPCDIDRVAVNAFTGTSSDLVGASGRSPPPPAKREAAGKVFPF